MKKQWMKKCFAGILGAVLLAVPLCGTAESPNPLAKIGFLQMDNMYAYINGFVRDMLPPQEKYLRPAEEVAKTEKLDGTVYAPIRFVADTAWSKIGWNDESQSAILTLDGKEIVFTADSASCTVNGKAVTLSAPCRMKGERLTVPLIEAAELCGLTYSEEDGLMILCPAGTSIADGDKGYAKGMLADQRKAYENRMSDSNWRLHPTERK